ncbi:hypothetical protein [Polaribacter sp.]|uniref:hypothetical protein n=1 Tax=Polaribacter sp. TaxID=1920175 RepID=UPI00404891E9
MRTIYILFIMLLSSNLNAQTLKQFTFQGKLSDVNENFTGAKTIEYTVYDLNDILWRENHENVAVKNGNYEVKLGSITSFPSTLFKTDVIERTVVIKVEGITQGFFRLPDFTQNNSVLNGKTLTVDFGKYGKDIDFDKIVVEDMYQKYAILCNRLADKEKLDENDNSGLFSTYEKILADFSKADLSRDGDSLFIFKIVAYVNKSSQNLFCDSTLAKKEKINLLKLAITTFDWEFIGNSLKYYKPPFNDVGQLDNMTVLDYLYDDVKYYQRNQPNSETFNSLKGFYYEFKKVGARHHKYPATTTID